MIIQFYRGFYTVFCNGQAVLACVSFESALKAISP